MTPLASAAVALACLALGAFAGAWVCLGELRKTRRQLFDTEESLALSMRARAKLYGVVEAADEALERELSASVSDAGYDPVSMKMAAMAVRLRLRQAQGEINDSVNL